MADEYIRKQDAVKASLEFTVEYIGGAFDEGLQKELKNNLESIEPADVVPVVRCKDCKFYTSMRPDIKTGICDLNVHHMGDDGFCSCGERREEDNG